MSLGLRYLTCSVCEALRTTKKDLVKQSENKANDIFFLLKLLLFLFHTLGAIKSLHQWLFATVNVPSASEYHHLFLQDPQGYVCVCTQSPGVSLGPVLTPTTTFFLGYKLTYRNCPFLERLCLQNCRGRLLKCSASRSLQEKLWGILVSCQEHTGFHCISFWHPLSCVHMEATKHRQAHNGTLLGRTLL